MLIGQYTFPYTNDTKRRKKISTTASRSVTFWRMVIHVQEENKKCHSDILSRPANVTDLTSTSVQPPPTPTLKYAYA